MSIADAALIAAQIAANPASSTKFEEFLTSGTFTPSAALLAKGGWVWVTLVGAGGGGSSGDISTPGNNANGGGGGGGGEVLLRQRVKLSGAETITLGAGGAGGAARTGSTALTGLAGANGGNSTFGSLLLAYGGRGAPNFGGAHSGGTLKFSAALGAGTQFFSGYGGGSNGAPGWSSGGGGLYSSELKVTGGACVLTGRSGGISAAPIGVVTNISGGGGGASWGDGASGGAGRENGDGDNGGDGAANSGAGGGGGGACRQVTTARTSGAGGNGGSGYCLVEWEE
jgi:hypothetical protein